MSDYEYLRRAFEERYIAEGRFAQEFQDQLLKIIVRRTAALPATERWRSTLR